MKLKVELKNAVNGYWDYGAKKVFYWAIDGTPQTDKQGKFVRVGSWEANSWFCVAVGRTEKITLASAKRRLGYQLRKKGIKADFSYIQ